MTNLDEIMHMTKVQKKEFLESVGKEGACTICIHKGACKDCANCVAGIADWLMQEVEK